MRTLMQIGLVLVGLCFTPVGVAGECDSECQLSQVKAYFGALDKVARKGSSVADIEALLMLMHPEVSYVHIEYDANFDKASWRRAFMRNLELGRFNNSTAQEQRILKSINGKNHLAVEYAHGVVDGEGKWHADAPLLALFGFRDGQIVMVKELW
ncbi:hypothetical protein ACFOEE_09450 [Pseudoalteromonas fenneropenaei]|uniref:Nuclear transport factor 2 family protein n=1 Tax=Pseudoalteromonas fenneropenaei TaxID=1737459 RepID=A0ABV7CJD2_9GAMM